MKSVIFGDKLDYPADKCIHELFEAQVAITPTAVAVNDSSRSYTYAELNTLTNQIARHLVKCGAGPGVVVGCHVGRSAGIIMYILAILKSGGSYLLLDAQLPEDRLRYMINDANVGLVVTDDPVASIFVGTKEFVCVISTSDIDEVCQRYSGSDISANAHPQRIAYISYTSGSTGRPKGVAITHQATVNHSWAFMKLFEPTVTDRTPILAPVAFDMATEEILPPLLSGSQLFVSASNHTSMPEFTQEIIDNGYTIINIVAPLWHNWVQYLRAENTPIPPSLRLVIVGSDKIYTSQLKEWYDLPGADNVFWAAAYGTTETTVTSSFYATAKNDDLTGEPLVPIGKPIANTAFYILDGTGSPVPMGEMGELCIGGDGLASGYLNLEDATAASFVPDNFCGESGKLMYKTGDLARFLADGTAVCLGRKDKQVKLNGLRIELGEIESVLTEHSAVAQAVVEMVKDYGDHLVAFVATHGNLAADMEEIMQFVKRRLHPRMVPKRIVHLPSLPHTASGKLDRNVLLKLYHVQE